MACWRVGRGLPACGEGADVPLLDLQDVRQSTTHGCGAAAFDCLFRFHHGNRAPRWTHELPDPARGLGPDTMELLVRRHFDHVLVGHIDVPRLRLLAAFTPVLCVVTVGEELDHWVTVRGVTGGYVHYQDPDAGPVRKKLADWLEAWTDSTAGGAWAKFALTGWPQE